MRVVAAGPGGAQFDPADQHGDVFFGKRAGWRHFEGFVPHSRNQQAVFRPARNNGRLFRFSAFQHGGPRIETQHGFLAFRTMTLEAMAGQQRTNMRFEEPEMVPAGRVIRGHSRRQQQGGGKKQHSTVHSGFLRR